MFGNAAHGLPGEVLAAVDHVIKIPILGRAESLNLATAAAPVRDGLLAGYYGERRRRPEIQFYDTAGTAAGATAAYARATAEAADFVVGPLGRDVVLGCPEELDAPGLGLGPSLVDDALQVAGINSPMQLAELERATE